MVDEISRFGKLFAPVVDTLSYLHSVILIIRSSERPSNDSLHFLQIPTLSGKAMMTA